jgi:DNA-directed RNA polymerase subunit beta'
MVHAGEMITDAIAKEIDESPIETVEVRSALTCEARHGICAKCYGRNLATMRMVQKGEAVGVIAAQSIGEPGTQLTLRTFHQGGTAGASAAESSIKAKVAGMVEYDDLRTVPAVDGEGNECQVVMSRTTEMRIIDPKTSLVVFTHNIPYGAHLYVADKTQVEKGELICTWDPHNAIIMSETAGRIKFEDIEQGQTYQVEIDDQTGFQEKIISEAKGKKLIPTVIITDGRGGEVIKSYNLPVGAHLLVENGDKVKAGDILVKIPRKSAKAGDITGGLPRVTELFEARNPSNPAVVAEIDGVVRLGAIKRGNKEIIITSKSGEEKRYLVKLSHQILVQDNDYVHAGDAISEGSISPEDILRIKGPNEVQEYLVNEVQGVYRMQGVVINDKHFEVIVRQMMRKVLIVDSGDTQFLEGQSVHKRDFIDANDALYGIKVVTDAGDSENLKAGQMVTLRQLKDENSTLRRADKQLVVARDAMPATAEPMLQGITRASLQTRSFISAASFQETTKVLNEAAVAGKEDYLEGLKENVIVGHKIPAGTGLKEYDQLIVGSREEYSQMRNDA